MGEEPETRPIQKRIGTQRWRLLKRLKAPKTRTRMKILLLDLALLYVDIGSDGYTAYIYLNNCNYVFGFSTLFFMMLPALPVFIDYMKSRIQEFKAGKLCWLGSPDSIHMESTVWGLVGLLFLIFFYFAGGFIFVAFAQVFHTTFCFLMMVKDPIMDGRINKYAKGAYRGKFLECQLEAAPQCIVQVMFLNIKKL